MTKYVWRANPKYWTTASDLENYINDPSRYVYWSTPQHQPHINIGDDAYIYISKGQRRGIAAIGKVVEAPKLLSQSNRAAFNHPAQLSAPGWNESNAPSKWKTGIKISSIHLSRPLNSPKPKGRQTVERI